MKIKENWHLPDHSSARKRSKSQVPVVEGLKITPEQSMLGQSKTYFISTYGCQANERDTETLAGILDEMGFVRQMQAENADVILLNTCGIRENAANTVLGEVGNLKKLYRENKDLVVGVCGCMAQEEGFVTRLLEKYPWVHLIFGTHNLQDLPEMLEKAMQGEKVVEVFSREGEVYENLPVHRYQKHKAWVNIMYGCDKFCTYCIVPYTRGKQRSRTMDAVLQEVKTLKKLGYREITLLGQNVNAYGKDLDEGVTFASLLEECAKTGIDRIRFMTSHPWDFSDEMIDIIAKYDNIMPAIHLPLQSGDSQILRRMGRRYTAEQYYELYSKIRERVPGVSITTDIIVGFPEESDEAFENTLEMVRKCAFDNAFTFIYSPRPGTPAAQMEDSIPMEVKKERLLRLNELWNALAAKRSKTKQDTTVKVLVDGFSKKNKEVYAGYTEDNKTVNFTSPVALEPGMIVPVHITDAKTFSLDGQLDLQCYNDKQEDFV